MARNAPAEISEETSPGDVDVIALPQTGWPGFKEKFLACFWELEEHLADLFGLNDSKYQWAVDQYMDERDAQKDQEDFAAFEQEQEMEMENQRVAEESERLEGGGSGSGDRALDHSGVDGGMTTKVFARYKINVYPKDDGVTRAS